MINDFFGFMCKYVDQLFVVHAERSKTSAENVWYLNMLQGACGHRFCILYSRPIIFLKKKWVAASY